MIKIEGVIFDWAGTTVDFGCFAPVQVFVDIFKNAGIEVTMAEAREPMGMLKIDHVRAMLSMPRIAEAWETKYGRTANEDDVKKLYSEFEETLIATLAKFTNPIPEVLTTVETLRKQGLKIGSTTGYTKSMMDIVVSEAEKKGYAPDYYVTADDTNSLGRPYPYMIYHNMEKLQLSAARHVVKVGDTVSDIKEALAAGVWAVGVVVGSSEMGLTEEEFNGLSKEEKESKIAEVERRFIQHGAQFTIRTMGELPALIETINEKLNA
ncbi:phosphonoacetaldehyde hydrolase [Ornithinibacillus sp. 4-3]|uniref:Phosphonoacetaldehyde hydrolase n=1 Tax=Ornithinibacillus sp. 4-3 TaxID=3231488 RepID=A0AB39HQH0_9BACI